MPQYDVYTETLNNLRLRTTLRDILVAFQYTQPVLYIERRSTALHYRRGHLICNTNPNMNPGVRNVKYPENFSDTQSLAKLREKMIATIQHTQQ